MDKNFNMVLAGIGSQGVLLASDVLAIAALEEIPNNRVRTSQIKGMSQRSASVIVHLRFGPTVDTIWRVFTRHCCRSNKQLPRE